MGISRDITERKKEENLLRATQQQFQAVFDQAAVGLAHAGLDDRWLLVNQRFCEIVGHRREDLTAYPILFWPVGAYLVIYRVQDVQIEIVAVTQGARDIPTFLRAYP